MPNLYSAKRAEHRLSILLPVVAILLLAAAARFSHAAYRPVWTDEGWSAWVAGDHHLGTILDKLSQDRHPPLYFVSLSAWWQVAGPSRLSLRWLSIAAGLLSVATVYRVGADWLGRRAACYAALLLAVLDLAVYYSQEIRHYGFLLWSVCLMSLFFLRYLRRPRLSMGIAYALSIAFMLYSLYLGLLLLAVQGVVGLLLWRGSRRAKAGLIAAWIGAALLFVPWLIVLFERQLDYLNHGIGGFPGSYATTLANLPTVSRFVFGSQMALTMGAGLLGMWQLTRRRDRSLQGLAQAYLVLGGIGLFGFMFIVNLRFGVLSARTLVYLTPLIMVVCGYGLSLLDRRAANALALAWVVITLATPQTIQPRLDSQRAAQALAAEYTPGDLIILETGWDDNAFLYEIARAVPDAHPQIIRTLPWVEQGRTPTPVIPQIEGLLQTHSRVWVVQWLQPPQVLSFLDQGGDGFVRVLTQETSTGQQYRDLYPASPTIQAVLFERPALLDPPLRYGDQFELRGVSFPDSLPTGSRLHVDLWWAALLPPPKDDSVGVFLMTQDGDAVADHNGPPGAAPTTQWPVDTLVFDRHTIHIPDHLPPGEYQIAVNLYWYGDVQPFPVNGQPYAVIGHITIRKGKS